MSNIDPTQPPLGNPTTAGVRANFATAKAEIESLQNSQSGNEISIFGQMTQQQITDFRAGTFSFDVGAILQSIATYAAAQVVNADSDNGIVVRVPAGKGQMTTQVVMPAKTSLVCDGILVNGLANGATPPIIFAPGAHCERLLMDCNTKMGVVFGTAGVTAGSRIGTIKLKNVDPVAGIGVRFLGYLFAFHHIRVEGGLVGIDFGDGGGNEARQINGNIIYAFNNVTGVRMYKASICSVARLVAESSNTTGVQIDQSHDVALLNVFCFWNDGTVSANKFTSSSINIGANSVADPVSGLLLDARCNNTGPNSCAIAANIIKSRLRLDGLNSPLPTGNGNSGVTGVLTFGAGYDSSNLAEVHYDSASGHSGSPGNSTYIETKSLTSTWSGSLQVFGGIIPGSNGTNNLGETTLALSVDASLTTQIVPQNTALLQAMNTNEVWLAYLDLDIGAALATTGIILQFSGPAMTASNWSAALTPDVIAAANKSYFPPVAIGGTITFAAANQVGVGSGRLRIRGYFQPSANGTLTFQFAQATSSATAITLKAGSTARFRRIT